MPGFDGTGPSGVGPMMGRGFGPCCVSVDRRVFGSGKKFGRGWGSCFGWGQPQNKQDQIQSLKEYKQTLVKELESVEKELKEVVREE